MLGSVGGRHVSTRRRGSNPLMRGGVGLIGYGTTSGIGGNTADGNAMHSEPVPRYAARRRRAVTTSDHKSCALIQTRLKLGDIMWVASLIIFILLFNSLAIVVLAFNLGTLTYRVGNKILNNHVVETNWCIVWFIIIVIL